VGRQFPRYPSRREVSSDAGVNCWRYGNDGEENLLGYASGSGHAAVGSAPILNLEQGHSVPGWGRMIFYVADVDAFWKYLWGKGFNPESPRDASCAVFPPARDPDGHELSFSRPV
jgi:hypothetical protein